MRFRVVRVLWPESVNLQLFYGDMAGAAYAADWPSRSRLQAARAVASTHPELNVDASAPRWHDAIEALERQARRFRPGPHPRIGGPRSEVRHDDAGTLMSEALRVARALVLPSDPTEQHDPLALDWWDDAQFAQFRKSKANHVMDRINEAFEKTLYEERDEGSLDVAIAWVTCDEAKFALRGGLCLAGTGFYDEPETLVEEIVNEAFGEG